MRQEGEPSVEEILESIKKVIARDNRDTVQGERRRRAAAEYELEPAEPADADEAEEVLELGEEAPELPSEGLYGAPPLAEGGLTTESAARSMRESLAALAMIAEPGMPPQIVRTGETSLEGLTRELLKPMLAQWLDQHLPAMVERMVKAEIARIAGKRG
jgi:cell pole-organizing protein PopZ